MSLTTEGAWEPEPGRVLDGFDQWSAIVRPALTYFYDCHSPCIIHSRHLHDLNDPTLMEFAAESRWLCTQVSGGAVASPRSSALLSYHSDGAGRGAAMRWNSGNGQGMASP